MPIRVPPLSGSQFSGFLDDELGKLMNLSETMREKLSEATDPYSVLQETWNPTSLDDLCDYLINVAFFSDPIVIVDGWLVLTSKWWEAFNRPEDYPIVPMLREGLLQSFSRNEGVISTIADEMAGRKIVTYENVVNHRDYDKLRRILEMHDHRNTIRYVPWPQENMDASLKSMLDVELIKSTVELGINDRVSEVQWTAIKEQFQKNTQDKEIDGKQIKGDSTRQGWVRAIVQAIKPHGLTAPAVREIAGIGVKAYHMSRALALAGTYPSKKIKAGTSPVPYARLGEVPAQLVDGRYLYDGILNLRIGWKDMARAGKIERLRELGDPTTNIGTAKANFLTARERWASATTDEGLRYREYEDAAMAYLERINAAFTVPLEITDRRGRVLEFGRRFASNVINGAMGIIPLGEATKLATESAVEAATGVWTPGKIAVLQQRVRPAVEPNNVLDRREWIDPFRQGAPCVAPCGLDSDVAQSHFKELPKWIP